MKLLFLTARWKLDQEEEQRQNKGCRHIDTQPQTDASIIADLRTIRPIEARFQFEHGRSQIIDIGFYPFHVAFRYPFPFATIDRQPRALATKHYRYEG
ncbi:hypothetical protein SAMN04515647_4079 [Cohaesibacter sp. ES.047]|nr:hypothetical protein SAMN04515647_4079 [Cohaesibacter sp. ES.047]